VIDGEAVPRRHGKGTTSKMDGQRQDGWAETRWMGRDKMGRELMGRVEGPPSDRF
jgi:hypothetical protein